MCQRSHKITVDELEQVKVDWARSVSPEHFLPFRTPDGILLEEIEGFCTVCGSPIPTRYSRLRKIAYPNGVVAVEGIGFCCKTVSRFILRFRPEGGGETLIGNRWYRFNLDTRPSWWDLINLGKRIIKRLVRSRAR